MFLLPLKPSEDRLLIVEKANGLENAWKKTLEKVMRIRWPTFINSVIYIIDKKKLGKKVLIFLLCT